MSVRPGASRPGEIVDLTGNVLGRHLGVIHYTVGQRRGLDIGGLAEPLYVIRLDAENARVVVGPKSALGVTGVTLEEVNWLGGDTDEPVAVRVKVRSTRPPVDATLVLTGARQGIVTFAEPHEGVAPGQACVFYSADTQHDRVLGGGWIEAAETLAPLTA